MKTSKRLAACVLVAFMATSVVPSTGFAANDNTEIVNGKPSDQPPAKPGGADTMTYDYTGSLSGVKMADGTELAIDGDTLETETVDQNIGLAQNGGALTLQNVTLNKSGADTNGDNCNFYGINSILLSVNDDSVIKVGDATLKADSTGSNAIFATDGGTVYANNSTIVTSASNSRGLDATYDGTVIANRMAISTAGNHSAAVATDRGGGSVSLTNSTLFTAGSGSPLLYSTGNVQVDNVDGTATGSQLAGMEGLNTILIRNATLTSEVTGKTASDPVANGVIIYQSTSGDAEASTGETADFEVADSTLSSAIQEGAMFYLTNTTANMVLKNTTLDFDSDKANLLTIGGNDANNWGTPGSNGATVTLTGLDQTLDGNIDVDTISSLDLYLLDGSTYTGATTISENTQGTGTTAAPITISVDEGSSWILTADSTISALHLEKGASVVDEEGKTVTIEAGGETVVDGDSALTLTVTGSVDDVVTTNDNNTLSGTVIDRSDFDVTYETSTIFGDNAGAEKNTDVTIQEATGGDDVQEGGQPSGGQPPEIPQEGGQDLAFTDVSKDYWAYEDIEQAVRSGLLAGTATNTFSPEVSLTRGMLVTILHRLEDDDADTATASDFSDVDAEAYYADAVAWAEANNIVSGYSDGTFRPNRAVSREEYMTILFRYALTKGYDTGIDDTEALMSYADQSQISDYSEEAVLWAVNHQYLRGTGSNTLTPQGTITRAQGAAILMRFLNAEEAVPVPDLPTGGAEGQPPVKPEENA